MYKLATTGEPEWNSVNNKKNNEKNNEKCKRKEIHWFFLNITCNMPLDQATPLLI